MDISSFEIEKTLATMREFVEQELIPLEPLLLNHEYETLMERLAEKRGTAKALGFDIDYRRLPKEFNHGTLLRAFYYTAIIEDQEDLPGAQILN